MPMKRLFYSTYLNTENNTSITSFIETYGIKTFEYKQAYQSNFSFEYVYVIPEKNYSKKLVFLIYHPDGLNSLNNSILWVKLIDQNETLPKLNNNPLVTTSGFTIVITITSIIITLMINLYLKKK